MPFSDAERAILAKEERERVGRLTRHLPGGRDRLSEKVAGFLAEETNASKSNIRGAVAALALLELQRTTQPAAP